MGAKLLEIDATAIKFICEAKKQSTSSVHLSNISDEYVAFKVKTTSPKRFCVRPNSRIISPKSACNFTVTMQGLRSAPSEVDCKDKFLIQSTVVDSETKEEEVTLELFSKSSGKYVEEKKLRVILISKQDSPSEEHENKVSGKEPSNEATVKEENVVKREENVVKRDGNVMKKDEKLVKMDENAVKRDENVPKKDENVVKRDEIMVKKDENDPPMHTKVKDHVEIKGAMTTEEPNPSGDPDENERNLSKNPKFNPATVVKADPERKLRLCKQLKDLKLRETTLESQLKEAKSTISNLTCQDRIIIEAKETLQLELTRKSKTGFPFVFVCIVSLIGLISGYFLDP